VASWRLRWSLNQPSAAAAIHAALVQVKDLMTLLARVRAD
jgi:hypothetical protein